MLLTFVAPPPRSTTSVAAHIETDAEMFAGSTAVGALRREGAGTGTGMYALESESGSSALVSHKGISLELEGVMD